MYYLVSFANNECVKFAHSFDTNSYYEMKLSGDIPFLEVTYIKRGGLVVEGGCNGTFEENSIVTLPYSEIKKIYTKDDYHGHVTMCLLLDRPPVRMTEDEVLDWFPKDNEAIFPLTIPDSPESRKCLEYIEMISGCFSSLDLSRNLKKMSYLYKLAIELTDYSIKTASKSSNRSTSAGVVYCRKALKYINQHITEKIYVDDVAKAAGISYGYLRNVFYDAMGMTIVDYINREKITRVKELLATRKITLEEAGASVSLDDVKYLSRLFKKHAGMTAAQFKKSEKVTEFN